MLIFLMHYIEVHATELVWEQVIFSLALLFEEYTVEKKQLFKTHRQTCPLSVYCIAYNIQKTGIWFCAKNP